MLYVQSFRTAPEQGEEVPLGYERKENSPVADKGSKALSEIRSIRKCIYTQRNATIFQTGKHLRER